MAYLARGKIFDEPKLKTGQPCGGGGERESGDGRNHSLYRCGMKIFDTVFTSRIRAEGKSGWAHYNAPKGKRFVFLLLGTHPKDSDDLFNPEKVLNDFGWFFRDPSNLPHTQAPEDKPQ